MNFNLRTFRLYGSDLWGSLLLSPTLTRTLKHLVLLRRSTKRFKTRRPFFRHHSVLVRRRRVGSTMRFIRMKLSLSKSVRGSIKVSKAKNISRGRVYYQLKKLLPYRFFSSKYKAGKHFSRNDGSRFVVDFLKSSPFDKVFINPRRRTFLSQLAMNYRKFQKFYANINRSQFVRMAYLARLQRSNNLHFFINRLERRLDVALFRNGLASSLFMAKHFISYKHVEVNDLIVSRYSYFLSLYDKFSLDFASSRMLRKHVQFRFYNSLFFNRFRAKGFPSRLPIVHFMSSLSYEVDYIGFSSILIAEVFLNSLYYPFKIDPSNIELYINRSKKRL